MTDLATRAGRPASTFVANPPTAFADRYLTLDELSTYSRISVRRLRDHLRDAEHPLPHYRPGGKKIVVRQSEFDRWMATFRCEGDPDLDKIVGNIISDLQ